jgi:hypothetical protein
MNGAPDRRKLIPPHLADSTLLAHLDGELSALEAENAQDHLRSCWSCRRRLSALESSIEHYLDQCTPLQPHLGLDGEQRVRQFRERLSRHASVAELTLADRLRSYGNSFLAAINAHRRAVLASVVAAGLLAAMFTDVLGTRVSADTILSRAKNSLADQPPKRGEVKRTTLHLDRVERKTGAVQSLGTIVTVEDPDTSEWYLTFAPPSEDPQRLLVSLDRQQSQPDIALLSAALPAPLAAYLHTQHWLPEVTVEAFLQLTANRGVATSAVKKEPGTFVLIFPFAEGHASGISEARLRVDQKTFTTMGLSLFLESAADSIEYRFTSTATSIEPRTTEIARLFSPHDTGKSTHSLTAREPAKTTPLSYAATHATDEEVRLNVALHQSDACLGEEIHVFPMSDGSLLVQGLVDQADRRNAVRAALHAADPDAPSQIFLPQELKNGSQLFNLPYQTPDLSRTHTSEVAAASSESSGQRIPLYAQLFQHFSRPGTSPENAEQQINAFSNEAVTLSRQTFLHAWALKKLDLEFSPERSLNLAPASVKELERMRQDHRHQMAAISRRQSEMLALVGVASSPQFASDSSMPLDSDTLLRLAREQNELVRSLFTVANNVPETNSSVSRLLALLHRLAA